MCTINTKRYIPQKMYLSYHTLFTKFRKYKKILLIAFLFTNYDILKHKKPKATVICQNRIPVFCLKLSL